MVEHLSSVWWVLVVLGFVGGIVCGALGVGSGIIFVPALVIAFAVPQKGAQGVALAVMVPMALLGAFRYWRNPDIDVDLNLVALLVVGALGGVLIGTEIAIHLPAHWLRKAFAVLMVVAAVRMFTMGPKQPGPADGTLNQPQAATTANNHDDTDRQPP